MVIDDDGTDVDYLNDGWECVNEDGKKEKQKHFSMRVSKKVINQTRRGKR